MVKGEFSAPFGCSRRLGGDAETHLGQQSTGHSGRRYGADPLGTHRRVEAFGVRIRIDEHRRQPDGARGGHCVVPEEATDSATHVRRFDPEVAELTLGRHAVQTVKANKVTGLFGNHRASGADLVGSKRQVRPARLKELRVVAPLRLGPKRQAARRVGLLSAPVS